jgi:leucyl/phenylalanyl-tRNA--protein transferase
MTTKGCQKTLDPDLVLRAYCSGYFPMADSRMGGISWYSPDPRSIIPFATFNISRSLRQVIRKRIFEMRIDTAFRDVMRSCARRENTWISDEIIETYAILHSTGHAHSVESWWGDRLMGGLYGVAIGGAFFGESMFSAVSNASKVALVHLVELLKARKFKLLDAQFMNEHLKQFGAIEIPRSMYLNVLSKALAVNTRFT